MNAWDPSMGMIALGSVAVAGLAWLWIGALVSISRRASAMSGLELIGWSAFVVFAQLIGPLIWFFVGRDRYTALHRKI